LAKGSASRAALNTPRWRLCQEVSHGSEHGLPNTIIDPSVSASGDSANRDRDKATELNRSSTIFRLLPKQ
jgi:hypothetical protein